MFTKLTYHWGSALRAMFVAMGGLFLLFEAYEVLTNNDLQLPFILFIFVSILAGLAYFWIDGHFLAGYLKNEVTISSNSFDTNIVIKYGDYFKQQGWKAVAVGDFFDSQVDDDLVSSNSLHGRIIKTFWPDDSCGWQEQVHESLKNVSASTVQRATGNTKRFPIGTTACAISNCNKFLFVALGKTNKVDNVTSAGVADLIHAVRGLLCKARSVCSNEPLIIPLMGSGLARVNLKNAILVDLILAAIFEETKQGKITGLITIVLPYEKENKINLAAISRDWK